MAGHSGTARHHTDELHGHSLVGTTTPQISNILPKNKLNPELEDLRTKAKGALIDLHQNRIGLEQLSAEGIDASLLKELYLEAGIQVDEVLVPPNLARPTSSLGFTVASTDQGSDISTRLSILPRTELSLPADKLDRQNVLTSDSPSETLDLSQNTPGERSMPELNVSKLPTESKTQAQKHKISVAFPSSKSAGKTKVDQTFERKDYIARMIAERTGKPVAAKVSKAPESTTKPAENSTGRLRPEDLTPRPDLDPSLKASFSPGLTSQTGFDAKKKAQTELLRQKTEALKRGSSLREVSGRFVETLQSPQSSPSFAADPNSTYDSGSISLSKQPSAHLQISATPQITVQENLDGEYTPATPFFASLETPWPNGLPGLNSSYQPESQSSHLEQSTAQSDTALSNPIYPPYRRTDELKESELPATAIKPDRDPSASIPSASETDTVMIEETTKTPLMPNTVDKTRKRATAADFIDAPSNRVKRRIGSTGHVQVFIEVSEDEEDEGDNSDGTELDGVVPSETSRSARSIDRQTTKATAIRELPPSSNLPMRSTAQITPSYTPPAVQTPGKVIEPEELARTEEKIRALKQKIAETERRKKARETVSGVQTPAVYLTQQTPEAGCARGASPVASATGPNATKDKDQALETVSEQLQARKNILDAAQSAMENNLEADRKVQAAVLAKAEEERQGAARATTVTEKRYRQNRKTALEAALPALDAQIETARLGLEKLRRQKEELEEEIKRGSEGRRLILEELDALLSSLEMENKLSEHEEIQDTEANTDIAIQGK